MWVCGGSWLQVCLIHLLRWPLMAPASVTPQSHARTHWTQNGTSTLTCKSVWLLVQLCLSHASSVCMHCVSTAASVMPKFQCCYYCCCAVNYTVPLHFDKHCLSVLIHWPPVVTSELHVGLELEGILTELLSYSRYIIVLWQCWLGHLTDMTYNVFGGTLNPTQLYQCKCSAVYYAVFLHISEPISTFIIILIRLK